MLSLVPADSRRELASSRTLASSFFGRELNIYSFSSVGSYTSFSFPTPTGSLSRSQILATGIIQKEGKKKSQGTALRTERKSKMKRQRRKKWTFS